MKGSSSRQIVIDSRPRRTIIECDITHLHPLLGKIVQEFNLDEDATYSDIDGKKLFVSAFQLFGKGETIAGDFSKQLNRQVKDKIWEELFALKSIFFEIEKPDVVVHFVKHPFNFERRYERYKNGLLLPDYDFSLDLGSRTIYIERK